MMDKTPKGYCEVCKRQLVKGDKIWKKNICEKCWNEPCKVIGCGGSETIDDELDYRKVMAEKYLKPEKELPF